MFQEMIDGVCRAFWRRIEPFKNLHERELPKEVPVEFRAHMGTALSLLDIGIEAEKLMDFYQVDSIGKLIHAQSKHIERLQARLPKDDQPILTTVREG